MRTKTMYCLECKEWVPCAVPDNPTSDDYTTEPRPKRQRWKSEDYPDVRAFVRTKTCENGHAAITYEIDEGFVTELIKLRKLVERLDPAISTLV